MMINDSLGNRVGSFISPVLECTYKEFTGRISISKHNLAKGKYFLCFNVGLKTEDYQYMDYDIVYNVLSFEIAYIDSKSRKEIQLWRNGWGNIQFQQGLFEVISAK